MSVATARPAILQGLERGLAVIEAFSDEQPCMTLSEVARQTGISRATARRILLTLEELGYVRSDGRRFSPSPRALRLGSSSLSAPNLWDIAQPFMEDLAEESQETCSAATLHLPDIIFVARVPGRRILTMSLAVGSRLPAYTTAMGRVLLAGLDDAAVEDYLAGAALDVLTEHTLTDPAEILATVRAVRDQGWALVDEELELGLRSLSVPLRLGDGRTLGALNLCAATSRVSTGDMRARFLPPMLRTAGAVSTAWSRQPRI